MCELATIASLVLAAGGYALQSSAQAKADSARNTAMQNERNRQAGLQREMEAVQAAQAGRYDDFEEKKAGTGDELAALATGNVEAVQGAGPGQANATAGTVAPGTNAGIVTQEAEKQRAGVADRLGKRAVALGNFRSFGDTLGDVAAGVARDAGQIGQIGGFMQGSNNANAYAMDAASHAGDKQKGWADLAGLASGAVGGMATGKGGGISGMFSGLSGMLGGGSTPAVQTGTGAIPRPTPRPQYLN